MGLGKFDIEKKNLKLSPKLKYFPNPFLRNLHNTSSRIQWWKRGAKSILVFEITLKIINFGGWVKLTLKKMVFFQIYSKTKNSFLNLFLIDTYSMIEVQFYAKKFETPYISLRIFPLEDWWEENKNIQEKVSKKK